MGIERTAAYWPTQWPQFLVGKHIEVNQSTDHYAFTKLILQGSLSTATAAAGVVACASEGVNLVIDGLSYGVSFPVRLIQHVTNPAWLDRFYQTLDSRPKLADRIERILSQALGALISLLQTSFLFVIREYWSTQLHEHLGNYKPSAHQLSLKSSRLKPEAHEKKEEASESEPDAQPPGEASAPATAKTAPPSVPRRETPPPEEPAPARALSSATPIPAAPPPPSSSPASLKSAMSSKSSSEDGSSAHATEGTSKPAAKKKKRVVILSRPPTDISPINEGSIPSTDTSSLQEQIRAKKEERAAKGEDIAKKIAEDEAVKANAKKETEDEKIFKKAFAKISARRVESVHFTGYDDKHGNLANGKVSLRPLARTFQLPFPKEFTGTLGEYVLQEFEKQNLPIEAFATCEILDEDWGTAVRLTITKMEQDPTTGKNTILQVGLLWQDVSVK